MRQALSHADPVACPRLEAAESEQRQDPRHGGSSIWAVIPTYNEAENLVRLIPLLQEAYGHAIRILIVDDGSSDGTDAIVQSLGEAYTNIILWRRPQRGLGTALREGLTRALADPRCEYVCTLDADLSHDPAQLPALLDAATRVAFVQGSRYVPGARISNWSSPRLLLSLVANRLCRLTGSRLREHTTNFRVYGRAAAEVAIRTADASGFAWIAAVSLAIQAAGLSTAEVPITFLSRTRGRSKLSGAALLQWGLFFVQALLRRGVRVSGLPAVPVPPPPLQGSPWTEARRG